MKKISGICSLVVFASSALIAPLKISAQDKPVKEWIAPVSANDKSPVASDAKSISDGKDIFTENCKSCHGAKGKGDGTKAVNIEISCKDFSSDAFAKQSDGALFYKITEGRKPMPSFKEKLSDNERWLVIAYIRTLHSKSGSTKTEAEITDKDKTDKADKTDKTKTESKKDKSASEIELNKEYTTASGLQYKITKKGAGKKANPGDQVSVHYAGTLTDSAKTKFDSSRDRGQPFSFALGAGQVIKGWDEGIALLHVGDVAVLTIPSSLGYGDRAMGKIPANATLVFEVELMDVKEAPKPWDVKGLKIDSTANGLKYIVIKKGSGPKAANGQKVSVHYTGFLGDGTWKIFDSSVQRGQPIQFGLGSGQVIKGWDEGIALMNAGEKMRLIIPYQLGYGEEGHPPVIPQKATLIFDVELVSILEDPKPWDVKGLKTDSTADGLKYIVVKKGSGAKAENGKKVKVHYSGFLGDGTWKLFDSSVQRGQQFEFTLGAGQVIKGWDEGIALMHIGDKVRLIIPYPLAYGESGRPPIIPQKATLIFDVELFGVE
ncbi:MAG TPA: FKBP-type peptidyl-prolyl cis-trans isomerase [Bacteroidia bacterium]